LKLVFLRSLVLTNPHQRQINLTQANLTQRKLTSPTLFFYSNCALVVMMELPVQELPPKPQVANITDPMWLAVNYLATSFPNLLELPNDATKLIFLKVGDYSLVSTFRRRRFSQWITLTFCFVAGREDFSRCDRSRQQGLE